MADNKMKLSKETVGMIDSNPTGVLDIVYGELHDLTCLQRLSLRVRRSDVEHSCVLLKQNFFQRYGSNFR